MATALSHLVSVNCKLVPVTLQCLSQRTFFQTLASADRSLLYPIYAIEDYMFFSLIQVSAPISQHPARLFFGPPKVPSRNFGQCRYHRKRQLWMHGVVILLSLCCSAMPALAARRPRRFSKPLDAAICPTGPD